MKTYEKYKDSGVQWIGEIPSHWIVKRFKDCHYEVDNRVEERWSDFPLLSLSKKGVIPRDIDSGVGKFPGSFNDYKEIEPDDLIFCLYDIEETPRTIGLSDLHGMITGSYKVFRTNGVLPKYTYYVYLSIDDVKGLKPFYTGLRNVVRPETFKSLPFITPPLPEQHQIVSFLDEKTSLNDDLIKKKEQKIGLLKEYRTSLINRVITKGLNPDCPMKDSGVEWIGEIPSHWDVKRLKHLSEVIPSNVDKHIYPEEIQVRLCNYTDVYYNEKIDSSTELKSGSCDEHEYHKYHVQKNDVIITKDSESPDDIGVPCLISEQLENVVCGYHLTILRPVNIDGEYLFRFIQTDGTRRYFEVSSNGMTRYGLGKSSIENLFVCSPPLSEQHQIVTFLDQKTGEIDRTIQSEKNKIELLKEYRQSLISSVITGKIKVVN